jgi:LmbE family N-acetylglucosaminyl deacetylase
MSTASQRLDVVPEDWQRALAVVAHPDDLEYGAAAAIARWTGQGKQIAYCLATSGEAGIDSMPPEQAGPVREAEQCAAAAVVGVSEVEFFRLPDGVLEYGLPLRRAIAAEIRRHRPEIVIGLSQREVFPSGLPNQADHVAVGRATIDAVRDAGNRWVFRDLLEEGLEPWPGVHSVLMVGSPRPTHAVDVTDTFDRGLASLREHRAYLEGLGNASTDFLADMARETGERLGVPFAVAFEAIPLGF